LESFWIVPPGEKFGHALTVRLSINLNLLHI
jgi:hypothetical protein